MNSISWNSVAGLTDDLAIHITKEKCGINLIVAVARGGFVPAYLLSTRLGIKRLSSIGIMYVDSERARREIYSFPSPIGEHHRILLVEDALETGRSLSDARDRLVAAGAIVWTAAFFYQSQSIICPDFSLGERDNLPRFPWE